VEHHGREYHVGVAEQGSSRYYVVYDDSGFELRETLVMAFLSGSVLLAIVSATWLGFSMSGRVIEPIADLARRVERLEADDTQRPLAADYPADEVGTLARAIDAYRERLNAFVRREREFTADASHELRTPLAVIQAASEGLLAREDVPQNVQQRVERIHRAAAEMARTLTVLLELARESRMPSASAEQTDIAALVEQLVEDQRPGLAGRPLELAVETTARPHVGAPPAVVSTVIGNLLRNALAYTEQGHVRIHLDTTRLRIEDTGPGIAAFDLPKVFERGFRTSAVTAPGNGLGLAIARRICDQFAWELQLGNTHGGGAWAEWRFGAG
jgi:signal transduction histidine kinase